MSNFTVKALALNKKLARPRLYSITQGTIYAVPMRLKKMARDIEAGTYGSVTDSVVILRYIEDGRLCVQGYHFGPSSVEIVQSMLQRVVTRLMKFD